MGINIRAKGATGEQEIATDLNLILKRIYIELKLVWPDKPIVQRNSLQSAVGGCDLVGTYGMAIEVKRQEALSINTWWAQCIKSAQERREIPVLLFRQNAKPGQRTCWRCITLAELPPPFAAHKPLEVRVELSYEDFKVWFYHWAKVHVMSDVPECEPELVELPIRTPRLQPGLYDLEAA